MVLYRDRSHVACWRDNGRSSRSKSSSPDTDIPVTRCVSLAEIGMPHAPFTDMSDNATRTDGSLRDPFFAFRVI